MTAMDPTHSLDAVPLPVPTARGRRLGRVALVGSVLVAAALGLSAYQLLAELDPVSLTPFAGTGGWFVLLVVSLLGVAGAFLLAVLAVFVSRPRTIAVLALCTSIVLPAAALAAGTLVGVETLRRNTTSDLADGGTAALSAFSGTLRSWGVEPEPLLDVLREP